MKLQVALDMVSDEDALRIAGQTADSVDIIEAGTPLIKSQGIDIVRKLKKKFPDKKILADLKTMDTGFLEAELAFRAGADIATVCGSAPDSTIIGAVKAAKKYGRKILTDLIGIKKPERRVKEVIEMGSDYACFHVGIDEQNKGIKLLNKFKGVEMSGVIAVAGGINIHVLDKIVKLNPEIIIVGAAITKSDNPGKAAEEISKKIKGLIK